MTLLTIGNHSFAIESAAIAGAIADALAASPAYRLSNRIDTRPYWCDAGKVEITRGLTDGQTVVVAGQQRLQRDGSPLRIVALGQPPKGAASAPSPAASR